MAVSWMGSGCRHQAAMPSVMLLKWIPVEPAQPPRGHPLSVRCCGRERCPETSGGSGSGRQLDRLGTLDGESHSFGPGDVAFAGVGSVHGFWNDGPDRVRWIETQAPQPPSRDAYRWQPTWKAFAERGVDAWPGNPTKP
jgi:hypothetical protein